MESGKCHNASQARVRLNCFECGKPIISGYNYNYLLYIIIPHHHINHMMRGP